jgi:glycosyltransferase involved in cell wall biosynthesis
MFTDRIVAVSECVRADIIRFDRVPAQKVRVIRNGIDLSHFQREVKLEEVKIGLGLTPEARILGTVGRMTPQKDQATLLEAFARLPRGGDLKLLVIGDGPLRMRLQKKADDLKISSHVCFAGPRRDIYPLLCAMEVFVLPSLWEGMPTAIVEAMAAGKVVVASDIPPVKEIISSPELGVLVPPGDAETLAEVLQQVLEDPGRSRRMGRLAQEYAWARFPIQKAVSQYQDLFGEIDRETQERRSIS